MLHVDYSYHSRRYHWQRTFPRSRVVVVIEQSISLPMTMNPPYRHKDAGPWQTSPSIEMTPPRGSGRPTRVTLNPNATFDLLQPRSPVPAVASPSSSVSPSPSPFAPPSRSSLPERENDMTAISVTGPGDDPARVSRENDGQTDPARKSMDNDVEMRDRYLESQPSSGSCGSL
ncbi:hypothetical protein EDB85DRAFT_1565335 [Lactarius pseudohatsudake]|nr:hypothetical protein EDB85DRAFT_1565335 [Lactarius pseudohatsudake]